MSLAQVRVAVIGVGEIGRGWASMCVAAGWPVTLFDNSAHALEAAAAIVGGRARALAALERADENAVEIGISGLTVGRSLLKACGDAQWIIESIEENLLAKQKLFEAFESVAPNARAVTSSTSGLAAKDLVARCRRPDRVLVAHPMNPPELIPLVELIPGAQTDGALVEVVKGWLRALGRMPVVLKKSVTGNVAGRIAAAVWREAIDLVLQGVIDVDDLDRAVSLGPALTWAAGGPHLTHHLAAGERELPQFIQLLCHDHEARWANLARWEKLEPVDQNRLIHAIEMAYAEQTDQVRRARNRRIAAILRAVEEARTD
ncbi:MAG TPA: 3-hydroxyacyl-CoA dehydrogenase NAD-binding domain-containing protein [Gemmatimonadales bacterium]|nr:3-hydroxyacyl-CoA dehydrogenase NAD-binding domain-containing protein [Gemmatimonadales bacterium]